MIITPLQFWCGSQRHWGIDILRIETDYDGRALFSVYYSKGFGWEVNLLFIEII